MFDIQTPQWARQTSKAANKTLIYSSTFYVKHTETKLLNTVSTRLDIARNVELPEKSPFDLAPFS